jgi:hypothetical protein
MPATAMTLRDVFAAHALAGIMASHTGALSYGEIAVDAFSMADVMLTERDQPTQVAE